MPRRGLRKQDSFVGEIIFENQMLHSFMEEQGLDEDESDEEEIDEIDEIDNLDNEAVEKDLEESQSQSQSQETKLFRIGTGNDSPEPENVQIIEMVEINREKMERKPKSILINHLEKSPKYTESNPSQVRNDVMQTSFGLLDEDVTDENPLLPPSKSGNGKLASVSKLVRASLEKLSLKKTTSKEKLSVDDTSPLLSPSHSTASGPSGADGQTSPNTGMSSLPSTSMSSVQIIEEDAANSELEDSQVEPGMLSNSAEVSLSKISLALSDSSRSAFRVVTPLSSRAPSLAGSRAVSKESSIDMVGACAGMDQPLLMDYPVNDVVMQMNRRQQYSESSADSYYDDDQLLSSGEDYRGRNHDNVQVVVDVHGNTKKNTGSNDVTLI